ncbi:MAG: segregation/condensation protein A [Bacilli bacterium]|nr:segregation/condensation protein A [Bacilli bacterium]
MEYKVMISEFEGPLDLLLHLLKESSIEIFDIEIEKIAKQYLDYIHQMEKMNLNIASEYLSMAAELIEMKSSSLLPKKKIETEDEYEEDPRERLIERLLEYQKYKEITPRLHELEEQRHEFYSKDPESLKEYIDIETNAIELDINLNDLLEAFKKMLERKELEKPLQTKVTKKEYSVSVRSNEIRNLLKQKKQVEFYELFEIVTKDYVIVTFLSILDLARKQELCITQNKNFNQITLELKGSDTHE